jgi:hypothetical protein
VNVADPLPTVIVSVTAVPLITHVPFVHWASDLARVQSASSGCRRYSISPTERKKDKPWGSHLDPALTSQQAPS